MIALTDQTIDVDAVRAQVVSPAFGAIVVFEGITRDNFDGRSVQRLEYEAYDGMAQAEMARLVAKAERTWPGIRVAIVHRVGVVPVGEASVVIAVGAPHRAEGYSASRFVIDTLKQTVPIWKKEIYTDGSAWKANPSA